MDSTAYEAIRLVLDKACKLFEQLGIVIGQDADRFRVYKYRMSLLAEERFELIILPTKPGLSWEEFLRRAQG